MRCGTQTKENDRGRRAENIFAILGRYSLPELAPVVPLESLGEVGQATRGALATLHGQVGPTVAQGFAAHPALLAEPNVAANVVANIGLNVLPILGGVFAVAAIIGGTRYAYRKIVQGK